MRLPAFVTAVAVLVAVSGCGGSVSQYQQMGTAECLKGRGFVVRVGPRPTELMVYARHWTGTSYLRIGVLRFYKSPAKAEQAMRRLEAANRSAGSMMSVPENARNVLADLWLRADEEWRSCLTEA